MSQNKALQARLAVVAEFPKDYFLENIVVRRDNSALVSVLNKRELWFVPAQQRDELTQPLLLYTFQQNTSGIVKSSLTSSFFSVQTGIRPTSHSRIDSTCAHGNRERRFGQRCFVSSQRTHAP